MLIKILFALFLVADIALAMLLIFGIYISIISGGGNVLLPGFGIIIALPALLVFLSLIETILIAITIVLYRRIRKNSDKLS